MSITRTPASAARQLRAIKLSLDLSDDHGRLSPERQGIVHELVQEFHPRPDLYARASSWHVERIGGNFALCAMVKNAGTSTCCTSEELTRPGVTCIRCSRHLRLRIARIRGGSMRARLSATLRHLVQPQVAAFRATLVRESAVCPVTDVPLTHVAVEVDHAPPWTFANLVDRLDAIHLGGRLAQSIGLPAPPRPLQRFAGTPDPGRDRGIFLRTGHVNPAIFKHDPEHDRDLLDFTDPAVYQLARAFEDMHHELAELRFVSQYANRVVLPAQQRLAELGEDLDEPEPDAAPEC